MVNVTIESNVASIHMDDGKVNALNTDTMSAIIEGIDEAEAKAGCILISGREGFFSAGFDLKAIANAKSPDDVLAIVSLGEKLALRLLKSPLPVIGACTGHAIAMGAFILLSCDFRLGAEGSFTLGANETTNGMVLPDFAIALAEARIDPRYISRSIILSEMMSPEGAITAGYLDKITALDNVMPEARGMAEKMAALPTNAFQKNKALVRENLVSRIEAKPLKSVPGL